MYIFASAPIFSFEINATFLINKMYKFGKNYHQITCDKITWGIKVSKEDDTFSTECSIWKF